MGAMDDGQLISQYRETGEIRFFDELVRRHIGRVRSIVYPMVLNDADADELTQEVFLRVVRSIGRFRQNASFSTWLYRITTNTTYSFLKRRARKPFTHTAELPDQPDPTADPLGPIAAGEIDARIRSALASLSPKLRSALVLTAMQGLCADNDGDWKGPFAVRKDVPFLVPIVEEEAVLNRFAAQQASGQLTERTHEPVFGRHGQSRTT